MPFFKLLLQGSFHPTSHKVAIRKSLFSLDFPESLFPAPGFSACCPQAHPAPQGELWAVTGTTASRWRHGREQKLSQGPCADPTHPPHPLLWRERDGEENVEEELGISDLPFPGSTQHCLLGSSLPQNGYKTPN